MELDTAKYLDFHCPRWNDLPELELYMDQVLSIIEKNLAIFREPQDISDKNKTKEDEDKDVHLLTPTMINNYVKHRIIPHPVKKRYSREHLAYLHIICIGKRVLSMSELKSVIEVFRESYTVEQMYDLFCDEIEKSLRVTFGDELPEHIDQSELPTAHVILYSLARAFSNKVYAQCAIATRSVDSNVDCDKESE